jgi:hypothetical protein
VEAVVGATLVARLQQVVQVQQAKAMLVEQVVLLETVMVLEAAAQVLQVLDRDRAVQVQELLTA